MPNMADQKTCPSSVASAYVPEPPVPPMTGWIIASIAVADEAASIFVYPLKMR